jgi:hypothetical protein
MVITNKTTFHTQGINIPTSQGNFTLIPGNGITLQPAGDSAIIAAPQPPNVIANGNALPWQPPLLSDATAPANSIYYSTTSIKLVYKDSNSVVHNLY